MRNHIIFSVATLALACGGAAPVLDRTESALVERSNSSGIFTRDIFVSNGAGGLIEADIRTTPLDEELYAFSGANLGVTMGEWEAASGSSAVHCAGGNTHEHFDLQGLIPGGVYSIFHFTFDPNSQNPFCSNEDAVVSVESFTADASGAAKVHAVVEGCLLDAQIVNFEVIYHADGQTWGALPNHAEAASFAEGGPCRSSYSSDAFRHVLIAQKGL